MGKAQHLVATGLLSVKEIMVEVVSRSKSYFVRDFRKAFGLAPSEYKKRALGPHSDVP